MQIRQEKGKHTTGPYRMRVWIRVPVTERVPRAWEGPAPRRPPDAGHSVPTARVLEPTWSEAHPGCGRGDQTTRWGRAARKKLLLPLPERKELGRSEEPLKEGDLPPTRKGILKRKNTCSQDRRWGRSRGLGWSSLFETGRGGPLRSPPPAPGTARSSSGRDGGRS